MVDYSLLIFGLFLLIFNILPQIVYTEMNRTIDLPTIPLNGEQSHFDSAILWLDGDGVGSVST